MKELRYRALRNCRNSILEIIFDPPCTLCRDGARYDHRVRTRIDFLMCFSPISNNGYLHSDYRTICGGSSDYALTVNMRIHYQRRLVYFGCILLLAMYVSAVALLLIS